MHRPPAIPRTTPEVLTIIGDRLVLPPPTARRSWQNSRLVVGESGEPIALLLILAEAKFGPWDPSTHYPVWQNMDWTDESLENVQLVGRYSPRTKRPRNESGFPSGTPEYYAWYRKQNPDKVRTWTKRAYEKKRGVLATTADLTSENEALRKRVAELEQKATEYAPAHVNELFTNLIQNLGEGSRPPQESEPSAEG